MRSIPVELADHYARRLTSLTRLFKMRTKEGAFLTFTQADHDITYDDGPDGPLSYPAMDPGNLSAFDFSASLGVDNAMLSGIINGARLTEQQIRAGILSHARFWVYEVNYLDLTQGHRIVASGFTGETKFSDNAFSVELRSKTQLLKQPIHESYEKTCTVAYGSPPCGKELEWINVTVVSVDTSEPDRIFTITPDSGWPVDNIYTGGVLRFVTGQNAGAEVDIEEQDGSDIELMLPLPYVVAPGDEVEIRIDCNKEARDAVYGCLSPLRWGDEWTLHHRGFPDIPTAAAAALLSPGAQVMGQGGGTLPMEPE